MPSLFASIWTFDWLCVRLLLKIVSCFSCTVFPLFEHVFIFDKKGELIRLQFDFDLNVWWCTFLDALNVISVSGRPSGVLLHWAETNRIVDPVVLGLEETVVAWLRISTTVIACRLISTRLILIIALIESDLHLFFSPLWWGSCSHSVGSLVSLSQQCRWNFGIA